MADNFLVVKQHLNEYYHKAYETIDEAHKAVNPSAEFPGEYVTVYNLETNRILHMEQFPGIESNHLKQIIDQYKK
jgi:hypothetical protein